MINILAILGVHLIIVLLIICGLLLVTKTDNKTMIFHFIILYILTNAMYFIPNLSIFNHLTLMWQAKILTSIICIIYILLLPSTDKKNIGFSLAFNGKIWLLIVGFLSVFIGLSIMMSGKPNIHIDLEYFLFSLSLPGIAEELFFRGIMMNIFNKVFISRKNILGISIGWAALIQILLFGVGHAVYFNEQQSIQFSLLAFAITSFIGIALTYVKEKSGSIFSSIILHNAYNTISSIL